MTELSPEMISAAWAAWQSRHGGKLGPGPAFVEAIEAALAIQKNPTPNNRDAIKESPWQWWAGDCGEWFAVGPEDSREAIIQAATNDSLGEYEDDGVWNLSFHIVEARKEPLRIADWIGADDVFDRAEDNLADSDRVGSENDEGPWFKCSNEQKADLRSRIMKACDEWQAAHGLVFNCATFSQTRNEETVIVDLSIEALADMKAGQ